MSLFRDGKGIIMTLNEILADIKSDRVKKVIIDTDACNEMDDQYAIAHAIASDRMEVLAINAAPYNYRQGNGHADGMERSYNEILRVLRACHMEGEYPVFRGSAETISSHEDFSPVDSPAARNIIKLAHETDEIIYILALGAITNVTSAILTDPSVKEKICVIWLGGHCLDNGDVLDEYNLIQDYAAGQILLNCGVPLIMLPAEGPDTTKGTQVLLVTIEEFRERITGDSDAAVFFRETLPLEFDKPTREHNGGPWIRVIWDIAAPGVIAVPDAYEFSIVPTPVFGDDRHYAFDGTRHKMICMERLQRDVVFDDAYKCINRL